MTPERPSQEGSEAEQVFPGTWHPTELSEDRVTDAEVPAWDAGGQQGPRPQSTFTVLVTPLSVAGSPLAHSKSRRQA